RLVAAAVLLWAVVAAAQLGLALLDARRGMAATVDTERDMTPEAVAAGRTGRHLDRARAAFGSARERTGGVAVAPLRVLPVVGRQLRSFGALAGAAEQVSGAGATAAGSVRSALSGRADAPGRMELLGTLERVTVETARALDGVDLGPGRALVPPLARRRAELNRRLEDIGSALDRGTEVVGTVTRVLRGPKRYLFLAANNAEMRAGSGMFLEAGVLETRDGGLSLGPLRPTPELVLPGEGVPLDAELAALWGWLGPGREWRNLGVTPRFDVTGRLAARMWEKLTGQRVDGVLAVDVEALRAVLAATGPVPVEGATVGAAEVVDRLLHDQYVRFGDDHTARRDELGRIATATLAALDAGRGQTGELVAGLAGAARARHVLAWAADEQDQRGWRAAGVSGELSPSSLAVAVLNRGGNKLDRFLEVRNRLGGRPGRDGEEVVVTVNLSNSTPPGEPPYVAGPHPESGVGEGTYLGLVAVHVPGRATDVSVDAGPPLVTGTDGPTQVVAVPVVLARGDERAVVVRFRLPGLPAPLRVEPSARVPPVVWHHGGSQWRDDHARVAAAPAR
ncbi:MAG TPA: DUF4012 domain-containing protein, partial [Acidimicrobiales bacterium]|nr:DUF4012 domain-containing protein [Acidimicrobiales bacterium]